MADEAQTVPVPKGDSDELNTGGLRTAGGPQGSAGVAPQASGRGLNPHAVVSGDVYEVGGRTEPLLLLIEKNVIDTPELVDLGTWRLWRSGHGGQPKQDEHGYTTQMNQEMRLWKQVMGAIYGTDW